VQTAIANAVSVLGDMDASGRGGFRTAVTFGYHFSETVTIRGCDRSGLGVMTDFSTKDFSSFYITSKNPPILLEVLLENDASRLYLLLNAVLVRQIVTEIEQLWRERPVSWQRYLRLP